MTVLNDIDRFHLVLDVIRRVPQLTGDAAAAAAAEFCRKKLDEHARYIVEHGDDMPEIRDWRWTA
jgi:xylulose-5-phosphate/fructose-6-phosphate phosphoketolase